MISFLRGFFFLLLLSSGPDSHGEWDVVFLPY